jgi:hypothetical protein
MTVETWALLVVMAGLSYALLFLGAAGRTRDERERDEEL